MMTVKLDDDLLDGIEQFIADRNTPPQPKMTHGDAINVIVRDWLMGQGYVPLPGEEDAIVPALEAASVPKY